MDAADLISRFSTSSTYQVTRRLREGTDGHGRVAQGAIVKKFSVVASVQPATGRDLQRLPEGRRTNETRVLFTSTRLGTGGQNDPNAPDVVTIDGDDWQVQHVESWAQPGEQATYFRCILQSAGS